MPNVKNYINNTRQLQITLLCAFGLLMPFSRVVNLNMILIVLLVLLAIPQGIHVKKQQASPIQKTLFSLFIFFGIILVAILYTENTKKGFQILTRSLPILLIPLSVLFIKGFSKKEIQQILKYYIIGCVLSILYCFILAALNYSEDPLPLTQGFTYFTLPLDFHPSYLAMYSVFAFCAFITIFDWKASKKRWIPYASWFLLLLFLLFLKSRAPLLTLMSVTFLMLIKNVDRKIAILITVPIVASILFFASDLLELLSQGRNITLTLADRLDIWTSAMDIIQENSIVGVGTGDYQIELDKQYYTTGFDKGIDQKFNCHNQFLQTVVSYGLIGFLSLGAILFFIFKKGLQTKSFLPYYFLTCVGILMFFDSILILQHGVYFFSFFAAILLKLNYDSHEKQLQ
ncbi:MAG: O-antigen ligase family protein [Bacteroidota bacterium]